MSYARKNLKERYRIDHWRDCGCRACESGSFTCSSTLKDARGRTGHLWWAIAMAVLACGVAFLVFSVFVRHDTDDDLHITSTRTGVNLSSGLRFSMKTLFAMRRANGDWFALDDQGGFRVPVFHSGGAAMVARSRESGMECFRPVALDAAALKNLGDYG